MSVLPTYSSQTDCRSDFFFRPFGQAQAHPADNGFRQRRARPWDAAALTGSMEAGMINPASAGRSKENPRRVSGSSELRFPACVHRWRRRTPREASRRRAEWDGWPEPRADRVHDPMERTARAPWVADTGHPGFRPFPPGGVPRRMGRRRGRGGTALWVVPRARGFRISRWWPPKCPSGPRRVRPSTRPRSCQNTPDPPPACAGTRLA